MKTDEKQQRGGLSVSQSAFEVQLIPSMGDELALGRQATAAARWAFGTSDGVGA